MKFVIVTGPTKRKVTKITGWRILGNLIVNGMVHILDDEPVEEFVDMPYDVVIDGDVIVGHVEVHGRCTLLAASQGLPFSPPKSDMTLIPIYYFPRR